jgi:hypothetical protein
MFLKVCFISPSPVQQIREEQSPPTIQMTINSDAFNLATKKPQSVEGKQSKEGSVHWLKQQERLAFRDGDLDQLSLWGSKKSHFGVWGSNTWGFGLISGGQN